MLFWTAFAAVDAVDLTATWALPTDRAHAERHRQAQAARNSLAARAGLRALLNHVAAATTWRLEADARGKPHALASDGRTRAISLSHSGEWVACAVGTAPAIGIDIERIRPRDFATLAARSFGADEAAWTGNDAYRFYKLWTLREAMAKATGEGLRQAAGGGALIDDTTGEGFWRQPNWSLFHALLSAENAADYSLAIAAHTPAPWPDEPPCRIGLSELTGLR